MNDTRGECLAYLIWVLGGSIIWRLFSRPAIVIISYYYCILYLVT